MSALSVSTVARMSPRWTTSPRRVEDNIAAMVVDDVPAATDGRLLLW